MRSSKKFSWDEPYLSLLWRFVGGTEIPMNLRLQAADKILNKAIANESKKEPVVEEKPVEKKKPKFSPRAVKKA